MLLIVSKKENKHKTEERQILSNKNEDHVQIKYIHE